MSNGGAAKACIRLHESLLKQGVESHILFLEKGDIDNKNIHFYPGEKISIWNRILYKLRIQKQWWEVSSSRLKNVQPQQFPFTFPDVDIHLEDLPMLESFDIIHLHWVSNFVNNCRFFDKVKKPIVWTLHDMNPFTGGCHYALSCNKYLSECEICPQIEGIRNANFAHQNWKIKKKSFQNSKLSIVSLNTWMSEKAKESSLLSGFRHLTIPNSIEIDTFYEKHKSVEKKIVLGFVSSYLTLGKGYDILLEAWDEISMKHPEITLLYIGAEIPEVSFKNVIYRGNLKTNFELADFYNAIDILILPSREDNLPNVMLEAMACGTPVIAFENGGMKDYIENGITGILAGNPGKENLISALSDYLNNKYNFSHSLIRKFAEAKFHPDEQASQFISLYQSILNG